MRIKYHYTPHPLKPLNHNRRDTRPLVLMFIAFHLTVGFVLLNFLLVYRTFLKVLKFHELKTLLF